MSSDYQGKHILLISSPRTRSNLTFRWIRTSPDIFPIQYPFALATRYGRKENGVYNYLRHSKERQQELDTFENRDVTVEDSALKLADEIQKSRKTGKIAVIFEQCDHLIKVQHTLSIFRDAPCDLGYNPTVLPDEVFAQVSPIILIRHPAAVVDSIYRLTVDLKRNYGPEDEDFDLGASLGERRRLFDHFSSQGMKPIVVDTWDILLGADRVREELKRRLGIGGMTDHWEPKSAEEIASMNPMMLGATKHINYSKGIERPENMSMTKTFEADVASYHEKWEKKYGDEIAAKLKLVVDNNMPHYEYLVEFRI